MSCFGYASPLPAAYRSVAGIPPTDPTDELVSETGTFTSATATLASSIDPAITDLAYKRVHLPGATEYVPLIVIPGLGQSAAALTDAFLERLAAYRDPITGRSALVIAITTRGRGNDGAEDCVRSSYDIADILDHAVNAAGLTMFGSGKSAFFSGYSTGSHGVLLFARRFPDRVLGMVCNWPNYDFLDPRDGYYAIQSESVRTTYLDVWLGDLRLRSAAVVNKYRAANPIDQLGEFLALDGAPHLWVFADDDDPASVPLPHHDRLIEAAQAFSAGIAITHVHVSALGDSIRYKHGSGGPGEGIASDATIYSERMWIPSMLGSGLTERVFPRAGRLRVLGYLETRRDAASGRPGFAVWLGANTAPRSDSVGGQGFVADLEYDDSGTTYRLDLRTTASGHAQVIRHLDDRRQEITAGTPLLVDLSVAPSFASLAAAGMEHDFDAGLGVTGAHSVSAWADQIGALSFAPIVAPTVTGTTNVTTAGLYGIGGTLDGLAIKLNVDEAGETTLVLNGATNTANQAALLAAIGVQWASVTATVVSTALVLTGALGGSITVGAGTANTLLGLAAGTYTNAPIAGTDGDAADYLAFTAASKDMLRLTQLAFDPREDFTLLLVVNKTVGTSQYYFSTSHHGTRAELAVWHNSTEKATYLLDVNGTYGTETANGVGNHTFSLNTKHVIVLRRHTRIDGVSVLGIMVDGTNWSESEITADTFTTTGTNTTSFGAGWADGAGIFWQHLTGQIFRAAWAATAKSDSDVAGMIARAKDDHAIA